MKKCPLNPAIKTKARTVVGRGEISLNSNAGSELRLDREKETQKSQDNEWDMNKKNVAQAPYHHKHQPVNMCAGTMSYKFHPVAMT